MSLSKDLYRNVAILLGAMILFVVGMSASRGFLAVDYPTWGQDWRHINACVETFGQQKCAFSKFPLAYLANSRLLYAVSSLLSGEKMLVIINLLFLAMPIGVLLLLEEARWAIAKSATYVVSLTLSPLPAFYVNSGGLEVQAGVVTGVFLALVLQRIKDDPKPSSRVSLALMAVSAFAFPLYKDTIVVPVVSGLTVYLAWNAFRLRRLPMLRMSQTRLLLAYAALPIAVALALAMGYNQIRYGTVLPSAYLQEARETAPSLGRSSMFLLGIVLSPNGGVLSFWMLPLFVTFLTLRGMRLRINRGFVMAAGAAAAFCALTFSLWWAPFGWDSWGNRLMIQPMLSLLVVVVLTSTPSEGAPLPRMRPVAMAAVLPVVLWSAWYVSLPYVSHMPNLVGASMDPGPACATMREQLGRGSAAGGFGFWKSDYYYDCASERLLHVPVP